MAVCKDGTIVEGYRDKPEGDRTSTATASRSD